MKRRDFLKTSAMFAGVSILPKAVFGANERLNIAFVGIGGKGRANLKGCESQNIHTLCDVDTDRGAESIKKFPAAKFYKDWRVMLDKEGKNIDAVVVTTPDHMHAPVAMAAMRMGKHVYCEKPLTRTISEARILTKAARKYKICSQMGNQGHAVEGARLTNEWIQSGRLGEIKEVHTGTNRPWWPQDCCLSEFPEKPVPGNLDWDLWLGVAPKRHYHDELVPFKWRGWYDFGAGALGDMAAHIIDHPIWALGLGAPLSVEAVRVDRKTAGSEKESFPASTEVVYKFAARGDQPPVTIRWFDGADSKIPHPEKLEEGRKVYSSGAIYYGSKYSMMHKSHGGTPRIFPESEMKEFEIPEKTMERSPGHYEEWFDAIKANDPSLAKSNFDYSGPLTETILLGCLAQRMGQGVKLRWDSEKMKTDNNEANKFLEHEYSNGWKL